MTRTSQFWNRLNAIHRNVERQIESCRLCITLFCLSSLFWAVLVTCTPLSPAKLLAPLFSALSLR